MSRKKKRVEPRYFQYIDGENRGKVVQLVGIDDSEGEVAYEFDDGETMFKEFVSPMTNNKKSLAKKFMVEIYSPNEEHQWHFDVIKETKVDLGNMETGMAPPLEDILAADTTKDANGNYALKKSMLGQTKIIFPKSMNHEMKPLPTIEWMYQEDDEPVSKEQECPKKHGIPAPMSHQPQPPQEQEQHIEQVAQQPVVHQQEQQAVMQSKHITKAMTTEEQAISILVSGAKKNETDVHVTITLGLPAKSLYDIANTNFENGGELFIKEIVKSLTHEKIVEAIEKGLKESYEQ